LSPRLEIVTIEAELILGLWLLSGFFTVAAWLTAISFFSILTVASLYMALTGQTSCGCFGRVTVSPWLAFAIDLAALVALALFRPVPQKSAAAFSWLRELIATGVGAAILLALLTSVFFVMFENPAKALAALRGESITVMPAVSDAGEALSGTERVFDIQLTNWTDRPVRIVGGTSDCTCIATASLPITLGPNENRSIKVLVNFRGGNGSFQHRFQLLTDDDTQRVVIARFVGRVRDVPE